MNDDKIQSSAEAGRVSWFDPVKRFGFVKLGDGLGDAFLHFDALKAGGYYYVPRGTTVHVRVERDERRGGHRVAEVLNVDTSTALEGEPPPLPRKTRAERREQQGREIDESQARVRASIAETERLLDNSDEMPERHRQECEDDDVAEENTANQT